MRRPANRFASLLAALAGVAAIATPPSAAALSFHPCPADGNQCATLRVPLDRLGAVPGTVALHVERLAGRGPIHTTILELAGGPGQAATPLLGGTFDELGISSRGRQLIAFDQRGTGQSGLLRCPALERADQLNSTKQAAACAASLGQRRGLYTTASSVADIEALRQGLAIPRIALYGVSYGTTVALDYARSYPAHVDRLLLDSTLPPGGEDPLYRDSYSGLPRILRSRCGHRCASFTADPAAELHRLVQRLGAGLLRGSVIDGAGHPRPYAVGREQLLAALFAGDFDDALRAPLAADVHAALAGDSAPLRRLIRAGVAAETAYLPPTALSSAVYAATLCEELSFPWDRAAALADRPAEAAANIAALGDAPFFPFDAATALASDEVRLCLQWPNADPAPPPPPPLPNVPTLIISGLADMRTPLEDARQLQAAIPDSAIVSVPGSGHSVLGANPGISCPRAAIRALFARPSPKLVSRRCPAEIVLPAPDAVPPGSLAAVAPGGGAKGLPGRTAAAVALTLRDFGEALALASAADGEAGPLALSAGGLRSGHGSVSSSGVHLVHFSFIPGVVISGSLGTSGLPGRLVVSGSAAARGVLTVRRGLASGRLGGVAVRVHTLA
ncbi:MAG: alpha/beta hydrolase [Solirubrobacteraceae bacterium]|nr:MAG: hypothetical protein DLM63_05410 [Solirubrobacterales bacterium]